MTGRRRFNYQHVMFLIELYTFCTPNCNIINITIALCTLSQPFTITDYSHTPALQRGLGGGRRLSCMDLIAGSGTQLCTLSFCKTMLLQVVSPLCKLDSYKIRKPFSTCSCAFIALLTFLPPITPWPLFSAGPQETILSKYYAAGNIIFCFPGWLQF